MTKNVLKLNDLRSETDLIDKHSGYDLIFLNDFMLEAILEFINMKKREPNHLE